MHFIDFFVNFFTKIVVSLIIITGKVEMLTKDKFLLINCNKSSKIIFFCFYRYNNKNVANKI